MTAATFLLTMALLVAAYVLMLLGRVARSLLKGRRNLAAARAVPDPDGSIRLFIHMQAKLMKLDAKMAAMLLLCLAGILALARQAVILVGSA